jgi:branched-chain amino acid transport system substrate-binding protein
MLARRLAHRGVTLSGRGALRNRRASDALVSRIARSRAQAMVFTGITANGAVGLWRKVHRRLPRLKLIGSDGIADDPFPRRLIRSGTRAQRRLGRSAAKRTWISLYTRPRDAWPATGRAFYDQFRARYGREPGEYAIFGYEAMRVALDCIAAATGPALLKDQVVNAFFAIRDRDSMLGRYSIDENGDSTLSTFGIWRVAPDGRGLRYAFTVDSAAESRG